MKHIGKISVLLFCVLLSFSCKREKIIPRGTLAEIYAEMLITDQWVYTNAGTRRMADTSMVYGPILEKYGYTADDYLASVDKYMNDAERFSRILRTSVEILDKRVEELKAEKAVIDHQRALEKLLDQLRIDPDFKAEEFFPYLFDEPYVHYYDSLDVKPDSVLMVYRMNNIERSDTTFDGVRLIVKDSLNVMDSQNDTLSNLKTEE